MSDVSKTSSTSGVDSSSASVTQRQADQAEKFRAKLKDGRGATSDSGKQGPSNASKHVGNETAETKAARPRGRPRIPEGEAKVRISMMIDPDTLGYFKSLGPGYQTLANALLGESLPGKRLEEFTLKLAEEIRGPKNN